MSLYLSVIGRDDHFFELFPALFTLGSNENDDVFLNGDGVLSSHAKVVFASDTLFVQSAQGPVYLDGKRITTFPQEFAIGAVLSIGEHTHLFYGDAGQVQPAIPVIDIPKEEGELKATPTRKAVIQGIGLVLAFAFTCLCVAASLSRFTTSEQDAIVAVPPVKEVPLTFIEDVLGSHLLSAIQDAGGAWTVVAIQNKSSERQAADLENTGKIALQWIDLQELMFHVKQSLMPVIQSKHLHLKQDGFTTTVSGTTLRSNQAAIDAALVKAASERSYAQIVNQVRYVDVDFRIVSTSVSNRSASATLARGNQVITVPEGGQVFDIGKLKIISTNGLLVDVGGTDVFIAWRKTS